MQIKINENGAVVLPLAPSPIVNAEVPNYSCLDRPGGCLLNPENGVVAGFNGKPKQKALSRSSASDIANDANDL